MDIIQLIQSFNVDNYEISPVPNKTKFSFKTFTKLYADDIHDYLVKYSQENLINISGEYSDGLQFDGEYNNKIKIKSLDIFFNHEYIEKYILKLLKISDEKAKSIFILDESDFENFNVSKLVNNKINIVVYPFFNENISNGYVYFLRNLNYSIDKDNAVSKKLKDVKQLSTVLLSNYYLPDFFSFEKKYVEIIPQNFKKLFFLYVLISLASSSNEHKDGYSILFKGFKTIELLLTQNQIYDNLKNIKSEDLMKIYNWIFDESKSADVRLNILRNLLTLDGNDQEGIFKKLSNPMKLLKSCEHQYELIIQGSIKEHFDTLEKTYAKVKEYVSSIDSQIGKLTSTINNAVIGLFGFAITLLIKITQDSFFPWFIYSTVLVLYLLYLILLHLPSIKKSKINLVQQFYSFMDLVTDKLKAIERDLVDKEFKVPIESGSKQFNIYYNVVKISLIVLLVILIFGICALMHSWYKIPEIII